MLLDTTWAIQFCLKARNHFLCFGALIFIRGPVMIQLQLLDLFFHLAAVSKQLRILNFVTVFSTYIAWPR